MLSEKHSKFLLLMGFLDGFSIFISLMVVGAAASVKDILLIFCGIFLLVTALLDIWFRTSLISGE